MGICAPMLTPQVLQFVHGCAAQLAEAGEAAEMALQLFLSAAHAASEHARLELIAYEFFEQARPPACTAAMLALYPWPSTIVPVVCLLAKDCPC